MRAVIFVPQLFKVNLLHFLFIKRVPGADNIQTSMCNVAIDISLDVIQVCFMEYLLLNVKESLGLSGTLGTL